MRIRKRTPARAASPEPSPAPSASPTPPPEEGPHEEDGAAVEEKRVILVGAGCGDQQHAPRVAAASKNSAMDDAPKQETEPQEQDSGRCSRNDGKRWRCKSAAVPGFLFCDRHVAWSTHKRKPRAKKQRTDRGGVLEPLAEKEEETPAAEEEDKDGGDGLQVGFDGGGDGFYYYGGFQPGSRKRARGGGRGPAA